MNKKQREQAIAEEMKAKTAKPIRAAIAVDFDGVIHSYEEGWKDGSIYGTPMEGSAEALQHLLEGFYVFIFTSRDPAQVKEWMKDHYNLPVALISAQERFWDTKGVIGITNRKLPAIAYIDDRAVPFHNWKELNDAFKS